MNVDWIKIEHKPEEKVKIEGTFLLSLRTKINELEKQKVNQIKELTEINEKLSFVKSNLQEELNKGYKEIEDLKTKLRSYNYEINNLKQSILDKNIDITEKVKEIQKIKEDKEQVEIHNRELLLKIKEKEKEIEQLKNDLKSIEQQKNDSNKEINDLKA
ncbi:MAG: hypothetical protein ACFE8C_11970, partial [Promethearchaeota archaeon]